MTFEEFFKKKKIDLAAFEKGNPALLFEFKNHFEKMGEKSFDHTKKYWFNKLRLQYHLAPEVKADKIKMENPLAEQTVIDSLVESTLPEPRPATTSKFQGAPISERPKIEHTEEKPAAPRPGFTPRFKAGLAKPAAQPHEEAPADNTGTEPVAEKPKGFTPRFKAGVTKPAEETTPAEEENKPVEPVTEKPKGFTPRFKAGVTKAADPAPQSDTQQPASPAAEENTAAQTPSADKPKIGFTPRFKAGVTKTAETPDVTAEENKTEETSEEKPKIVFTPRFKAGVTKSAEQADLQKEDGKAGESPVENKPKIGFTPRFKAADKQQKPPTED